MPKKCDHKKITEPNANKGSINLTVPPPPLPPIAMNKDRLEVLIWINLSSSIQKANAIAISSLGVHVALSHANQTNQRPIGKWKLVFKSVSIKPPFEARKTTSRFGKNQGTWLKSSDFIFLKTKTLLHGDKSGIYQSCHNRFLSRHKLMNRFEAKNNCVIVDHSYSNNLLNLYREVNIFFAKIS